MRKFDVKTTVVREGVPVVEEFVIHAKSYIDMTKKLVELAGTQEVVVSSLVSEPTGANANA